MKNVKTCLLALAVGTSFALAASAGTKTTKTPPPPLNATNYVLNVAVTNVPAPVVLDISGTPTFDDYGSNSAYGVVYTDGSGKIDGVEDMIFTNLSMCEFTSGDFITSIGGAIKSVGSKGKPSTNIVTVSMTMKGNGYVQNASGSTQSAAGLSLSFAGQLFPSNSVVNLTTTNTFLEIGTNFGTPFTNIYTYAPVTNVLYTNTISGEEVVVTYYTETASTFTNTVSGTNTVTTQNYVCVGQCEGRFGTPTGATNFNLSVQCEGTNVFTNVVIGTNITFAMTGTNVTEADTNYALAMSISNLSAWLAVVTNVVTTNGTGIVQTIVSVTTNTVTGSSGSSTNITYYAQLYLDFFNSATTNWVVETNTLSDLTFSNGWFEVDGILTGTIKAGGKCVQTFNGSNASFSTSFQTYTAMVGTGGNTNGTDSDGNLLFGPSTNHPYLGASDNGILYVVYEEVPENNMGVESANGVFNAQIKQVGKAIYASANGGFIGAGTEAAPKKGATNSTYKLTMDGVGRLSGSSITLTGLTGVDIVGFTIQTNVVAITNLAATPPAVGFVMNSNYFTGSDKVFVSDVGTFDYFNAITNGAGTTNISITEVAICEEVTIPALAVTNTVNCIKTVFGNAVVLGQKVSGSGTNVDISYPYPALPSTRLP